VRKMIKVLLLLSFVVVLLIIVIDWWAGKVNPEVIREYPISEIRSVEVCRNSRCFNIENESLPQLVELVSQMKPTYKIGWRDEQRTDLFTLKFNWGQKGIFRIRLWTRASIGEHVIATFEKDETHSTSFYGDYSAKELRAWLDTQAKSYEKQR